MDEEHYLRRAKLWDGISRQVIRLGGIFIIAAVISILLLMVWVALPLFYPARFEKAAVKTLRGKYLTIGLGPYGQKSYAFLPNGFLLFYDWQEQKKTLLPLRANKKLLFVEKQWGGKFTLLWEDNLCSFLEMSFQRVQKGAPVEVKLRGKHFPLPEKGVKRIFLRLGKSTRCVTYKGYTIQYWQLTEKSWISLGKFNAPALITAAALNQAGDTLYLGTQKGHLLRFELKDKLIWKETQQPFGTVPITALTFVLGDFSIALGTEKGDLATLFPVQGKLHLIHRLRSHPSPVQDIQNAYPKGLLLSRSAKKLHLDHMTTEQALLEWESPFLQAAISPKGHHLVGVDPKGQWHLFRLILFHPDVNCRVLFGKVWYEHYTAPAYVWQSSSSEDDFEPKYSLVPLIVGTLKGTFYAMIFSLPLSLLGAIYTSQFASRRLRHRIKYTVEMMAAIPSVVVGFLIALWLAPLLEKWLVAFFTALLFLPLTLLLFFLLLGKFWEKIKKLIQGRELSVALCLALFLFLFSGFLGKMLDHYFFASNIKVWLYQNLGVTYDQRNSIVIAFGLGFAVIPLIFSLVDDALSAVPSSLFAASLALGASRWQTVARVILPAALPGIFAAVMIGMGRAIGETMIVLMATGNTPIMSFSPFNGMRTLSANIAVELPEAPVGSSLYRVLFLSGVLLFLMTFVVNTLAEIVRMKLAKRFSPK